jgi:prepilin-type N-terminal cleavage/methylation domain-containing protein
MRTAFSLVELSIVLVILGLLTGGILGGQALIRAAELRAVTTEYQRYVTAVNSFRDKYFQLPGDMNNATQFWTSAGGTGADAACQAISSTTAATCNGDGNGRVEDSSAGSVVEKTRAWQHLANAGLIEGQFRGTRSTPIVIGSEVPRSKLNGASFWYGSISNYYSTVGTWNAFEFARVTTFAWPNQGAVSAEEAWNIDTKMDDGRPSTGKIAAFDGYNATPASGECVNAVPSATTADYVLTSTVKQACRFYMLM